MNQDQIIIALQSGVSEAISLINHLEGQLNAQDQTDPIIQHVVEQLKQLLVYSDYSIKHPLYPTELHNDN